MTQLNETLLDGVDKPPVEATMVQRFFSIALDILLEITLLIAFYLFVPHEYSRDIFAGNMALRYIPALVIVFGYRFTCLFISEKTIGMHATKIKYLNGQLQPLSTKEKLTAVFRTITSEVRLYKIGEKD